MTDLRTQTLGLFTILSTLAVGCAAGDDNAAVEEASSAQTAETSGGAPACGAPACRAPASKAGSVDAPTSYTALRSARARINEQIAYCNCRQLDDLTFEVRTHWGSRRGDQLGSEYTLTTRLKDSQGALLQTLEPSSYKKLPSQYETVPGIPGARRGPYYVTFLNTYPGIQISPEVADRTSEVEVEACLNSQCETLSIPMSGSR